VKARKVPGRSEQGRRNAPRGWSRTQKEKPRSDINRAWKELGAHGHQHKATATGGSPRGQERPTLLAAKPRGLITYYYNKYSTSNVNNQSLRQTTPAPAAPRDTASALPTRLIGAPSFAGDA